MSLLLFHGATATPSWTSLGINFRDTSGYVTDGTGETYCLGSEAGLGDMYPVVRTPTGTSNTAVFGYTTTTGDMGRDRDSALDRRLAGQNQQTNTGTQSTIRIDLPSTGSYNIRLALGDGTNAQGLQYLQVKDDSTALFTIADGTGTSAASFDDATGTEYSAANWPGSNSPVTHSFSSTICYLILGDPTGDGGASSSTIAHFYLEQAGGAAAPKRLMMMGVG